MLRFGPDDGPTAVLALPLFEEANRTRAFAVSICRALAGLDVGCVLPDLPGQGESTLPTERMRLADLRAAFAAVPGTHAVAIRSGALLIDARPCWMLAPQDGSALLRELAKVNGGPLAGERVEVAGNLIDRTLLDELAAASHPRAGGDPVSTDMVRRDANPNEPQLDPRLRGGGAKRIVRFASDALAADRTVEGRPLWRRAEPDNNPALAQTLAADIAPWIATCDA